MKQEDNEAKMYQQTENHATIAENGKAWISSDTIVEIKN